MKLLPTINYPSKRCKIGIKSKSFRMFENDIFKAIDDFEQIKKFSHEDEEVEEKEKDIKTMMMLRHFPAAVLRYLMFKSPDSFRNRQKRDLVMKAIDVAMEVCKRGLNFYPGKMFGYYDNLYETMRAILQSLKGLYKKQFVPLVFREFPNGLKTVTKNNLLSPSNMYFRVLSCFTRQTCSYGIDEISKTCKGRDYLMSLNRTLNEKMNDLNDLRTHMIQSRDFLAKEQIFPAWSDVKMNKLQVGLSEPNHEGKRFVLYKWEHDPFFRFSNFEKELLQDENPPEGLVGIEAALKIAQISAGRMLRMSNFVPDCSSMFSLLLFHTIQIRWVSDNFQYLINKHIKHVEAIENAFQKRRRRLLGLGYEEPSPEERKETLHTNLMYVELERGDSD